jgi:hypothetical protein
VDSYSSQVSIGEVIGGRSHNRLGYPPDYGQYGGYPLKIRVCRQLPYLRHPTLLVTVHGRKSGAERKESALVATMLTRRKLVLRRLLCGERK